MKDHNREEAYMILCRLERNKLEDSRVYKMLAGEFDRDLLTAESRLHLALPKVRLLFEALIQAGRSRPARRAALKVLREAKMKVR
jgi:hypothetical protein